MRRFALLVSLLLGLFVRAADKPNVLMIVGDDWGWTDFGFMGHPEIRTPNLDRLAKDGALFPNGYTPTSLCRASLATILTGQYAHQHRICCNDPPDGVARDAMFPFIKDSPAIPRLLRDAGYESFQTGKFWEGHFANAGFTAGMTTKGRHGDDGLVIGRKTLNPIFEFVDQAKGPWFVWYAPMMPHEPHTPPERLLAKYTKEGRDIRLAKYWAMCEWTDETVGELLAGLNKRDLRKNLLILFVVDNGWVQSTGPAKKGDQFQTRSKNTPYDAGVRTPVILHWEGHTKAGRYADLVSTVDLAPTVLAAADLRAPKSMAGVSLLQTAAGQGGLKRDAVFGEIYVHTAVKVEDPRANLTHRWVRVADWKLIVPVKKDAKAELYQLGEDPHEKTNLADKHPEVVERLRKRLAEAWTD
ncbi:MAG TPA: sulfatase-like hydrolase/transferase [Gemmataceae bacterium]|nr:sulfatase-like hydrolase/transferase [Gemmataceae bacterium]